MSKSILIVDDLFTNRFLLSKIVGDLGFMSVEVKEGKSAIEKIEREMPDLILMDIEMPVMNGIETTKYIRDVLKISKEMLPIIAVTAHDPQSFPEELSEAGFNGVFNKPFTLDKFKVIVREYLS